MSFGQIANPLLSGILIFAIPQGHQINQPSQGQPSRSLMTRVRRFIGTQPRTVSVGGTRSSGNKNVCLLSPGPIRQSSQGPEVVLVDSSPDLVLGSQLNEIEISSGSKVLWNQMATSKRPVDGRILWPIEPIRPGQKLQLGLRPREAAGGDWARMTLVGARKSAMNDYQKTLKVTANSSSSRLKAVDAAVTAKDDSKALALLWAPLNSSDKAIEQIRKRALASCSK